MVVFKSIKPATKFKSSTFRAALQERASRIAPKVKADFEKTTNTWKDRPVFEVQVKVGRAAVGDLKTTQATAGVLLEVFTTDEIYGYLDEGTKVRYATMSKDFLAKTRPGVIGSRAGRGRMLFVNKRRPRPGIKARKFTETIAKKWQPEFRTQMQQALEEGARASGHQFA